MQHAFWLVLVELWEFFWGIAPKNSVETLPTPVPVLRLSAHESVSRATYPTAESAHPTTLPVSQMSLLHADESVLDVGRGGTLYVVNNQMGATVYKAPAVLFDTAMLRVPFGQSMSLRQFVGAYAEVLVCGKIGFIKKEDITPHIDTVWPQCVSGTVYDAAHPVTRLVRQHINDEFLAGVLYQPLFGGEYVTVRLLRDRLAIPWSTVRPRPLGQWHTLLRGTPRVHVTIAPESDTIMEWQGEDGEGRVAYVEAVLPDQTVKISAVGLVVAGEYTESLIPHQVWREWRPVFIMIT